MSLSIQVRSAQISTRAHTAPFARAASVPLLSDSETGHGAFWAVSRVRLAQSRVLWVCVCGRKASLIFLKHDGLEFPPQHRSHKLLQHTHTKLASPACSYHKHKLQTSAWDACLLASFFILFVVFASTCLSSLSQLSSIPFVNFISTSLLFSYSHSSKLLHSPSSSCLHNHYSARHS